MAMVAAAVVTVTTAPVPFTVIADEVIAQVGVFATEFAGPPSLRVQEVKVADDE